MTSKFTHRGSKYSQKKIGILFLIKNLEPIIYYLKLRMERDRQTRTIYLTQTAHIDRIFEETEIQTCRPVNISMNPKLQLQEATHDSEIVDKEAYARRVGQRLHLAVQSRPDMAQAVARLAQFNTKPDKACWGALKHLLRYLSGTRTKSIIYELRPNPITGKRNDSKK
jgi:polyphosphate kinase